MPDLEDGYAIAGCVMRAEQLRGRRRRVASSPRSRLPSRRVAAPFGGDHRVSSLGGIAAACDACSSFHYSFTPGATRLIAVAALVVLRHATTTLRSVSSLSSAIPR